MATRNVVVDDSDENINYTGGWTQEPPGSYDSYGNFGPTYQHTTHSTSTGGVFTFPFNGTSIQVFGTTHVDGIPMWNCYVDGIEISASKAFYARENNWKLCEQDIINAGQHQLTVNVTSVNATFAFDYLQYTPSPSINLGSAVIRVDHSDPSLLFSDSDWSEMGGRTVTNTPGAKAQFNFTGKSLSWIGYIPVELAKAPANGTYAIDGKEPVQFKLNGLDEKATSSVYYQTFFTTQDLPQGAHTIEVIHNGDTTQTMLTLEYLLITNSSTSVDTVSKSTSASHPPIGAIVGGILGAVTLIGLVTALVLFFRKRDRDKRSSEPYDLTEPQVVDSRHPPAISFTEPYKPPTSGTTVLAANPSMTRHTPNAIAPSSEHSFGYHSTHSFNVSSTAMLIPGYSKSSMVLEKQDELNPARLLNHQSSTVSMSPVGNAEDVPPKYSPY